MPLMSIIIALIVVGVLLWLVNSYIPMDRKIRNILNAGRGHHRRALAAPGFGVLGPLNSIRVS